MPRRFLTAELLGHPLRFQAPAGLFSVDRIDDGTRLLLDALPSSTPEAVLDLGCGYGALGLPLAAHFPHSRCMLIDRQTLAVETSAINAQANGLKNVEARTSLGYRDLGVQRFDWVLCNVPARIGTAALDYLLSEGARRLRTGGELRVVVIRDLVPAIEALAVQHRWPLIRGPVGERHAIFGLPPIERETTEAVEHEGFYLRDTVEQQGLTFERPHDISEDPAHRTVGLPLLLELLPREISGTALVWRGGYGITAVSLALRGATVRVLDPDLLLTTFTRRNAQRQGVTVTTSEASTLASGLRGAVAEAQPRAEEADTKQAFIVGELPTTGEVAGTVEDLRSSVRHLIAGGQSLWLGQTRAARSLIEQSTRHGVLGANVLASRGPFSVWRLTKGAG